MFLDIIHRPVYSAKHDVSETGFCLRLQVKPTQLGPIDGAIPYLRRQGHIGTSSIDWAQLSRFYLNTETESSLRNVVFWSTNRAVFLDKKRKMDNVQKHNIYTRPGLLFSGSEYEAETFWIRRSATH
jgi:hypothetical protein